jgi:DNA invertase Pin-like site-specific DNA recombinase
VKSRAALRPNRKQLAKAIEALAEGDVLLVTRLDRLARSTRDLLNVLATIAEKGAGFRSIADSWAGAWKANDYDPRRACRVRA